MRIMGWGRNGLEIFLVIFSFEQYWMAVSGWVGEGGWLNARMAMRWAQAQARAVVGRTAASLPWASGVLSIGHSWQPGWFLQRCATESAPHLAVQGT